MREAQDAAQEAQQALAAARHVLDKALGLSTFDTFFGGGLLVDLTKYDRMDEGARQMQLADQALRRLSAELADTGMSGVGGLEVGELTRAFDVWLDNIFSDWAVRDRINQAIARTAEAARTVHRVELDLHARGAELEATSAGLARRREELLLPGGS